MNILQMGKGLAKKPYLGILHKKLFVHVICYVKPRAAVKGIMANIDHIPAVCRVGSVDLTLSTSLCGCDVGGRRQQIQTIANEMNLSVDKLGPLSRRLRKAKFGDGKDYGHISKVLIRFAFYKLDWRPELADEVWIGLVGWIWVAAVLMATQPTEQEKGINGPYKSQWEWPAKASSRLASPVSIIQTTVKYI
jgi:hypothetical protein